MPNVFGGIDGGDGSTMILLYIHRLGPLFGVKHLNFRGFQKNYYFWGLKLVCVVITLYYAIFGSHMFYLFYGLS